MQQKKAPSVRQVHVKIPWCLEIQPPMKIKHQLTRPSKEDDLQSYFDSIVSNLLERASYLTF